MIASLHLGALLPGRPSATTGTDPNDATKTVAAPYNAANSSGSNLGPTSKALADRLKADVAARKAENPAMPVPVDLVTTLGQWHRSGHHAGRRPVPGAARRQGPATFPRIRVRSLVDAHVEGRTLGIIGEPHVNVLALNRALDQLKAQ